MSWRSTRKNIAQMVSEPDEGLYDALNKGIFRATGDVVGFMHADDAYASPQALERVAAAFEDPAVGAVYGDLVYVNKDDVSRVVRYWRAGEFRRSRLSQGWMPPHPTFYVRREHYQRLGGFNTRFRIAADYENMLRILWGGDVNAAYIPEVLVRMRMGGSQQPFVAQHRAKVVRGFCSSAAKWNRWPARRATEERYKTTAVRDTRRAPSGHGLTPPRLVVLCSILEASP